MRLTAILALALIIPLLHAETIDELRARLVADDIVEATSDPVPAGVAVTYNDGNSDITVNELYLPVIVTRNDASPPALRATRMLITVYDYNGPAEKAHVTDTGVHNYVAPPRDAKELLYEGRLALITLRDNAIPIPAAPTAELPLVVSEPAWHGRIISAYTVRKDQTTVAGVPGSIVRIKLRVDGGIDDAVSVFIWVSNAGQYVVDPYED